ncbi:hypothetical protein [Gynuella sunshinyii]|uniref:DUF3329 domain-containing protein n=1 Tax=Gynuella sunshinyii YC6258 TaxID=1445510 RepID=A0A0C5VRW5_9GAMM|nr:hypothetical protein [Gynuella sunshinyii]AJQ97382.1 hypothetical Protein YC6258_05352 [Gynuella sunshinyii YC6258]
MKERDVVFFQPLWRRIAVTVFCFIWALYEWATGSSFWGIIALGMTGYCLWALFYNFEPMSPDEHSDGE